MDIDNTRLVLSRLFTSVLLLMPAASYLIAAFGPPDSPGCVAAPECEGSQTFTATVTGTVSLVVGGGAAILALIVIGHYGGRRLWWLWFVALGLLVQLPLFYLALPNG